MIPDLAGIIEDLLFILVVATCRFAHNLFQGHIGIRFSLDELVERVDIGFVMLVIVKGPDITYLQWGILRRFAPPRPKGERRETRIGSVTKRSNEKAAGARAP